MRDTIKIVLFAILTLLSQFSRAQVQDVNSPGFDFNTPDSTKVDSSQNGEESSGNPVGKLDPAMRPYERIILFIDSATNLISYNVIMEQEESGSDSLYARMKRWATAYLGKDIKIEVDKRNQKLTYIGSTPAYTYVGKYTKRNIGRYEFKITFLIKEGRYKFIITNLVHESVKPAEGKGSRNYFEYYYASTSHIRENDMILRNADKDIHTMINSIITALREPMLVDEDDW